MLKGSLLDKFNGKNSHVCHVHVRFVTIEVVEKEPLAISGNVGLSLCAYFLHLQSKNLVKYHPGDGVEHLKPTPYPHR